MSRSDQPTQEDGWRQTVRMEASHPHFEGYEVQRVLGSGGGGVVYAARHLALGRTVAIKTQPTGAKLIEANISRFRLEAQVLARLGHPNIVQVFDVGEANGQQYFALEFVDGGSLDDLVGRTDRPDWRQLTTLMSTVARAVHAAHRGGIVHRDLKPANILLTTDGTPKVADFGIAWVSDTEADTAFVGTPGYAAPEMVVTPWAATHAVDVFGLGATLYALITGAPPMKGATTTAILNYTAFEEVEAPSRRRRDVPRDLESVCLKALERRPSQRYPSAAAFADDLDRWLNGEPIQARRRSLVERSYAWARRNKLAMFVLVATVFGAVCSIDYMSRTSLALAQETALQGAAQEVETLERVTDYYTEHVVGNAPDVLTSTAYREKPGTIPVPATFTIEVGDILTGTAGSQEVRMYSDLPFANRKNGGPRNDFERDALVALRANPSAPYFMFDRRDGRVVLRYAKARVLAARCVACHNTHEESPRRDWKVGDVRGALEVVRVLDPDMERSRAVLRGASVMGAAVTGLLLLLAAGSMVFDALGRRRPAKRRR